jgi:hypothetical protein
MRSMKLTALFGVAVLFFSATLRAQTSNGQAVGTVTDATGGVLPGVTVTLTNQGTKIVRTIATNASGNFVFVSVPPGAYVIGAELSGFKSAQTVPFVIAVGETVNRSLSLAVGALSEAVTVAAQSPLLQVASSELGTGDP